MPVNFTPALIDQIIKGRCADFAAVMGMRKTHAGDLQVNAFLPGATAVEVLHRNGKKLLGSLALLHAEGLFSGTVAGKKVVPYKLRVSYGATTVTQDDPYRFPSCLDKAEMQLFVRGQHDAVWQLLGAHRRNCDDVDGVQFVLWAPAAQRVSLLCEQNGWDGRCHVLRQHTAFGLWELFVPGGVEAADGVDAGYLFEVLTDDHHCQRPPFDPLARRVSTVPECRTHVAHADAYHWVDHFWQQVGRDFRGQGSAIAIREVAIIPAAGQPLNWQQLLPLLEQTRDGGFTHLLLSARLAEVGNEQPAMHGLLAPDPALGSPDDLRAFVDQAHQWQLGVLWDVSLLAMLRTLDVAGRLSSLLQPEVLGGPLLSIVPGYFSYWHNSFHIDGFCVRDVDTLLQLSAPTALPAKRRSRRRASGSGNPFVDEWLSQLLQRVRAQQPELLMLVETTTQQEPFTEVAHRGGTDFDYRIAARGNDVAGPPVLQASVRQLLAGLQDGNRDQHLLSMPWQQVSHAPADFALLLLALWTLPGRKHLQLDCVLPSSGPRSADAELQLPAGWPSDGGHLLRDLNRLYQTSPCLYEIDASHEGISVVLDDGHLFAYERIGRQATEVLLIILNSGTAAADVEVMPEHAGEYTLRYHTPCDEGQLRQLPKLVRSAPGRSASGSENLRQKLALTLPACSGIVYAWRG